MLKYYKKCHKNEFIFANIVMVLLVYVAGCSYNQDERETPVNAPTLHPTPVYLHSVNPKETVAQQLYNDSVESVNWPMARGVVVTIWADDVGLAEENRNVGTIRGRVTLYLNEERVSNDSLIIGDGAERYTGPFYLSWGPKLMPGLYKARFQFVTDSGEILEYSWQFIIED